MSYLDIVEHDRQVKTENPAITYPFELDNFQKQAQYYIQEGHNILVTAHTSAGKTIPAEMAIAYAKSRGLNSYYTTPVKALSNQKLSDLSKKFDSVGLSTGDIKFNPEAQCVIMTTEILRDQLKDDSFKDKIDKLDCVIFDEVHYINDRDRGHVWEECIYKLPSKVKLIMLSATISEADKFAGWIGRLKQKPIHLISTLKRPVPLNHYVFIENKIELILDAEKNFNEENYHKYIADFKHLTKKPYFKPTNLLNPSIIFLQKKKLTPAIFFVFSRDKCLSYASEVTSHLTTGEEQALIGHEIDKYLVKHNMGKDLLDKMPQVIKLKSLMLKGIGVHHSGLLSIMKEITEILFSKGLIKVLFATETFAVGVNMPTKTVIFTQLNKHTGESEFPRMLKPQEYIQMAGRAGRRQLDKFGTVIHLPLVETYEASQVKGLLQGKSARIDSKLKINYAFVLQMLSNNQSLNNSDDRKFYLFEQNELEVKNLTSEKKSLVQKLNELDEKVIFKNLNEIQIGQIKELCELEKKVYALTDFNGLQVKMNKAQEKKIQNQIKSLIKDVTLYDQHFKTKSNYQLLKKDENEIMDKMKYLDNEINALTNDFTNSYNQCINDLHNWGYIKDLTHNLDRSNLTDRGVIATQIVSINEILMTELIVEGYLNDLDVPSLASIISLFCSECRASDRFEMDYAINPVVSDITNFVFQLNEDCLNESLIYQKYYSDQTLNDSFAAIAYRWAQGHSYFEIAADLGGSINHTFEGDFCRTMLRLAHICDELVRVCAFYKCAKLEKNLMDLKSIVIRDMVTFDSLYLKI